MNTRIGCLYLLAPLLVSGCGRTSNVEMKEVHSFGMAYHFYNAEKDRPPQQVEDLEAQSSEVPTLYKQIQQGEFIVVWNAALCPDGNENDKYVLGYEKGVPDSGGYVLLGGGFVTRMTPEQF